MTTFPVSFPVAEIAAVLAYPFNAVRLYKASSRTGAYNLLTTVTLVADQTAYSYDDTPQLATDWYRFSYFNTGTLVEGPQGEPFPAAGALVVSKQRLRRQVAMELGFYGHYAGDYTWAGPSLTTTSLGTSTTAIDAGYADTYWDVLQNTFARAFLLINDGAYAGQERPIASLNTGNGTFTVGRSYGGAIASSVTADLYHHMPSERYNAALFGEAEGAYLDIWQWFQYPLTGVIPATGDPAQTSYQLPYWIETDDQILRLTRQTGATISAHALYRGQHYDIRKSGYGVSLYFFAGIGQNSVYLVEGLRHPAPLAADTDTMVINEQQERLLVVTGCVRLLSYLTNGQPWLRGTDISDWKEKLKYYQSVREGLLRELNPWSVLAPPSRGAFVAVGGGSPW